jgi:hypothetical protein
MFGEKAARRSVAPISSHTASMRLLNKLNSMGFMGEFVRN